MLTSFLHRIGIGKSDSTQNKIIDPREEKLIEHIKKLQSLVKQRKGKDAKDTQAIDQVIISLSEEISGIHYRLFKLGGLPEIHNLELHRAVINAKNLIEEQSIDELTKPIIDFFTGDDLSAEAVISVNALKANFDSSKEESLKQAQSRLDEYRNKLELIRGITPQKVS